MPIPSDAYIGLPPDGAGKRLSAIATVYIDYQSATQDFAIGDDVLGGTSGAAATVIHVHKKTVASGALILQPRFDTGDESHHNIQFTPAESLYVGGAPVAQVVNAGDPLFFQRSVVSGANNPFFAQHVDVDGAAYTRFAEGSPTFDAYGRTKVAEPTIVGQYYNTYDEQASEFSIITEGSATGAYEAVSASVLMTNTTASGDRVIRRSHRRHKVIPGLSQAVSMGLVFGEAHKTNLERWWGLFDDNNGIFWHCGNGPQGLGIYVGIRSNVTGSVTETLFHQSDWNRDKLDGSGNSGHTVEMTNANIFWIDYQWQGSGRAAWGIYNETGRVVAHVFDRHNYSPYPMFRDGSLPLSFEQKNDGAVASSSEMRVFAASVAIDGPFQVEPRSFAAFSPSAKTATLGTAEPVFAIRPASTYKGRDNWVTAVFKTITLGSWATGTDDPKAAVFEVWSGPQLTGSSWATASADSAFEVDSSATSFTGGTLVGAWLASGDRIVSLNSDFHSYNELSLARLANGYQPVFAVTARPVSAGDVDAVIGASWAEIHD